MEKREALNILIQVTRQFQATADVHDKVREALSVLAKDCGECKDCKAREQSAKEPTPGPMPDPATPKPAK